MPFSFVQIEQEKTKTIQFSVVFLVLFYFLGALGIVVAVKFLIHYLYGEGSSALVYPPPAFLTLPMLGWTCAGAGLASLIHWQFSVHGLVDKILGLMSARAADPNVEDEKRFLNVVEEAGVATGGRFRIEPVIIPNAAMNAFAIQDFKGRSVIGVTEGLLKRLNREQLEAVVAHEAGHIASGDSLSTTVTSSVFKVFDNVTDLSRSMLQFGRAGGSRYGGRDREGGSDGRFLLIVLAVFILASLLRFLGFLGSMFISRQREYRADALAVRLTRNPQALAEALHLISQHWKGAGTLGQSLEAIFIQSPRRRYLEDSENLVSDLFSTHPPVGKRIAVLLDMAHADRSVLESALKKAIEKEKSAMPAPGAREAAEEIQQSAGAGEPRWQMLLPTGAWSDPLTMKELMTVGMVTPLTQVRKVGSPSSTQARQDAELSAVIPPGPLKKHHCPRCHVALKEQTYEGVEVKACENCGGHLVGEIDVLTIVGKREVEIPQRVRELGDVMLKQRPLLQRGPGDLIYDEKSIACPHCLDKSPAMTRRFVNPKYPVEVDKCRICCQVWFDKDELELLQYMYEREQDLRGTKDEGRKRGT